MKRSPVFSTLAAFLLLASLIGFVPGCSSGGSDKSNGEDTTTVDATEDPATEVETVDPATLKGKGETIAMALDLNKGDVFGYSIVRIEDVRSDNDTMDAAGEMVNVFFSHSKVRMQYDYKFEVLEELDDGAARIQATCKRVKYDGTFEDTSGTRDINFDSDADNSRDIVKRFVQYNAPVNTPYEFIVDDEGNIGEVAKLDGVVKRLLMDDYATTKLEARNMIQKEYSEMSLKNVIQQAFQEIQNKPLSVDSSWKLVWSGNIGFMQVRNTSTYTLTGYEETPAGKIAHITAVLRSEYMGKDRFETGQGMASVKKFNVGGRGASTFNIDTGKPLTRRMKQKLDARFYIEPPDELKQMMPQKVFNYYLHQDAIIENDVTPLQF